MAFADEATADPQISRPDTAARAGLFLGALAIGSSFQPNLLTRSTRDQAIISGLSATAAFATATTGSSVLTAIADRLPGGRSAASEAALAAVGAVVYKAMPARQYDSDRRAGLRLSALGLAALGVSSLASRIDQKITGQMTGATRVLTTTGLAAVATGATYLAMRSSSAVVGAQLADGTYFEDSEREVKPLAAFAVSVGVTSLLVGLAHGESYLAGETSRLAAKVLGGQPDDHVMLGRLTVLGTCVIGGRFAMNKVLNLFNQAGEQTEAAHDKAPTAPEITGSPASNVAWSVQSREGRRWLSMTLTPADITTVMAAPAKQPIRVYASLEAEATDEARAALLLSELDRTNAFERSVLAVFSPTGSGYVNYVATETLEYLTLGDCASAAIEYSVLPSSLSLTSVPLGTRQTRLVIDGIVERLLKIPAEQRPKFVLFGESLGSQVSQGMFTSQGMAGPKAVGLDYAVWIGTPSATTWRKQLVGTRPISETPKVDPGAVYLPRSIQDWHELDEQSKKSIEFLLLENGDDPIPKFGSQVLWREPSWLGPDDTRPIGSPKGTSWVPVVTFLQTFIDMLNALTPTPGIFAEGGHDYRVEIPEALRTVWRLEASDEQMSRVQEALRRRELRWETARKWEAAEAIADPKKRETAEHKAEATVAGWTGEGRGALATPEQIENIINEGPLPTDH